MIFFVSSYHLLSLGNTEIIKRPGRFLFNTLQSFYGIPQKARTVTVRQSGHMPKSAKMVEDIVWGRDNAKNMRREYAAERKSHVILCENCRKAQNDSNDNSFKCCMACKQKMDRKIYYCSKSVFVVRSLI